MNRDPTIGDKRIYTLKALESVKVHKAAGPDSIPESPLTAIISKPIREGILRMERKMANVIPSPKNYPTCVD